ncbi:hypothetical protein EMIT0P294_30226 [Pseudomonas sp. IT-P294]
MRCSAPFHCAMGVMCWMWLGGGWGRSRRLIRSADFGCLVGPLRGLAREGVSPITAAP